jgi:hypothetical protein
MSSSWASVSESVVRRLRHPRAMPRRTKTKKRSRRLQFHGPIRLTWRCMSGGCCTRPIAYSRLLRAIQNPAKPSFLFQSRTRIPSLRATLQSSRHAGRKAFHHVAALELASTQCTTRPRPLAILARLGGLDVGVKRTLAWLTLAGAAGARKGKSRCLEFNNCYGHATARGGRQEGNNWKTSLLFMSGEAPVFDGSGLIGPRITRVSAG